MSHPVSRPDHPDHAQPWALQLVIQRVKQDPATHQDVLEAAGTAVVRLLDDPRVTTDDGPWAAAVAHWRAGWIRKVARRAENKRWDDVQQLDGVTVTSGSASVRAFVPGPAAPLVPALKKLQVGGTEFPRRPETFPRRHETFPRRHETSSRSSKTSPGAHATARPDAVVTVELNPSLELTTGKAAAQVGHAAQLAYEFLVAEAAKGTRVPADVLAAWRVDGFSLRVSVPTQHQWDTADRPIRVVDSGLTEISSATETARASWSPPVAPA